MKTESVLVSNLCVPCACRCRHCLLSWDGRPAGVSWERGAEFARRFRERLQAQAPALRFGCSFGYAMEPPDWHAALSLLRALGSPQAEFLQCGGMRMRGAAACADLTRLLAAEGVKRLNFTFYGTAEYHDRFAGRRGDFDLLTRMISAAGAAALECSAGIALNAENAAQMEELVGTLRERFPALRLFFFIPHGEGRGAALEPIRLSEDALSLLPEDTRTLLDRQIYRTEREWLAGGFPEETRRMLLVSLRPDNIGRYETTDPGALVAELEALDDAYYAAFPALPELAERYGDPDGGRFFRQRDLFHRYRRMFAEEHGVSVYDVTDERQSGSRRY